MKLNTSFILAVARRDLRSYFSSPTGYVFTTLFILLSAAAAFWQGRFFANNLANLAQLNELFPLILLFFIPALTMSSWSEERRRGTDELLLTLPGTDLEVVLGKFVAVVGVYTASLILSVSHVAVLSWLGSPDLGLMFANYLGYWLLGCALISVGMLASLLTRNATVAFILGAVFCSLAIFVTSRQWVVDEALQRFLSPIGVQEYFSDFARGVLSLSGLTYFISLMALMLYLNVILLGRRHWSVQSVGAGFWKHQLVRAVSIFVAVMSFNFIVDTSGIRFDATAEGLHSLSDKTRELIRGLPTDRPVFIQAYISPEVPRPYVQTRANLIDMLEEMNAISGGRVQVAVYDVEPYSDDAREGREKFGITSREVLSSAGATATNEQIFMGLAFTSGANEEVIPFFDRGLPVEYELTRSIRTVAETQRRRVGVLTTRAKVFGGMDFQTFQNTPEWAVVKELRKQYDVVQISAEGPIVEQLDALVVVLPSSLSQIEMNNLERHIATGNPTLLLIDPMPMAEIALAPILPSDAQTNPFARSQGPPPEPKGRIDSLLIRMGVLWSPGLIVWDNYNPHPELAQLQPEIVFVGSGNQTQEPFNQAHPASSGLQEVVMLYPGFLLSAMDSPFVLKPLIRSGRISGASPFQQLVQQTFFGLSINPSDQFFQFRERGVGNLNFDNVSFVLNCIDVLAGDSSFIDLRKKRVRHRTLTMVEAESRTFVRQRMEDEQAAEREAQAELGAAQRRLDEKVAEVRNREDLDEQTKQIMMNNLQEVENRRFEVVKASIEANKQVEVQASKERMESAIRGIQSRIRTLAVLLPPIPALLVGVVIFVRRRRREIEGTKAARRKRK
jgi:ABC-2 type transport system permease protein